ncbi:MAG: TetR/AcrR family transcriptional regulator [Butyrivibrio sp.]|nr:TetR/AcrR family transcriptional regulator [Butyrivibrio sp.]
MAAFTEKAIIETFVKILNEKPIDKITVKEIIDTCQINRSTFYYYFADIYDLIDRIFENETASILEKHAVYDSWAEGVKAAMSFAIENKRAIFHIYKSVSRERLERYISEVLDSALLGFMRSQCGEEDVSEENIRLVTDIYKYTLTGLLCKWLEEGMTAEPIALIDKLAYMLEGSVSGLLKRAGECDRGTARK